MSYLLFFQPGFSGDIKGHKILLKLHEFMIEYPSFKSSFFFPQGFWKIIISFDLKTRIRSSGSAKNRVGDLTQSFKHQKTQPFPLCSNPRSSPTTIHGRGQGATNSSSCDVGIDGRGCTLVRTAIDPSTHIIFGGEPVYPF